MSSVRGRPHKSPEIEPGTVIGAWRVIRFHSYDPVGRRRYVARATCCGRYVIRRQSNIYQFPDLSMCSVCSAPSRYQRRAAKERGRETWRQKDRRELLRDRSGLREGHGLLRCQLPRVPELAERHLAGRDVPPCASLVFPREMAAHLRDVHRVADVTTELLTEAFHAVEDVSDKEDAA